MESNEGKERTVSYELSRQLHRMGMPQGQTKLMWSKEPRATIYHIQPQGRFGLSSCDALTQDEFRQLADYFYYLIMTPDLNGNVESLIYEIRQRKLAFKLKRFKLTIPTP